MSKFNVVELTKQMVAINTVSDLSNLQLAEMLKGWLKQLGFNVELQKRQFMHDTLVKANLIARFGPQDNEALMFSAHMDTVPPGDQHAWETDPFSPRLHNEKLWGLGSVDMKGSIAAMICAVEPLVKERLRREIIFGLTFDEEVGLVGAKHLVDSRIIKPKFALIGEPTMMKPMRIHKGHIYLEVVCHGGGGHASDPEKGINAIQVAVEAIRIINQFADELKGCDCSETDPPYATANIGTIYGGTKPNVIASRCVICFDIRPIPGMTSKPLIQDINGRLESIGTFQGQPLVSVQTTRIPTEPVSTDPSSEIIQAAEKVTGERARGVSYGTDGSVLQELGTEILILGPGSITRAHKPNEFVAVEQLDLAVEQFREIARLICVA
jgi:acetylornithine deacetylase